MNLDVYNAVFPSVFIRVSNSNDTTSVALCNSEMCCKTEHLKKRVVGKKKKTKSKKYGGTHKNTVVALIVVDDRDIQGDFIGTNIIPSL